jgi:proline racemase
MEIKNIITTVDTDTEGGPTRIITSGLPYLSGRSVSEKQKEFISRFDGIRNDLLNHPRGYPGMFGAVLTEPCHPDAHVGVFFMTNTGYLNMCVHSAIGVGTACLETGMIPRDNDRPVIRLDSPAGLITLRGEYTGSQLRNITIEPGPAKVHTRQLTLDLGENISIKADLVFSAVLFLLIDLTPLGLHVEKDNQEILRSMAKSAIEAANEQLASKPIEGAEAGVMVDLAFLYQESQPHACSSVVFSKAGVLDQSPCGAGTGAKMALSFSKGELMSDTIYTNRNIYGRVFQGRLIQSVESFDVATIFFEITGTAKITGFHRFLLN